VQNVTLQPALPCRGLAGSDGRPSRRAGSWPVSGQIRDRRFPARLRTTSAGSPPPGRLGPSTEPLGTPQTTCNSIRSSHEGCPPHRPDSQGHRRTSADETDVTGRTGGHQPAGRRTGGHQSAGQLDPGPRNQMTGHRTAGHRTAGHRTAGHRTPDIGTEWVDTEWWTRTGDGQHGSPWHSRPLQHRPTAGALSASSAVQCRLVDQQPGQLSRKDTARPVCPPPRPDSGRVTLRRPARASAHCSPRTISGRA
jgi:hypothetical protein